MGLKVNDDNNKVKVKVKKTKVKTKSKSNAQRGIDNSKNDINNKRQKVRKRVKKNTDLTPKVARNTKADAAKYSALPTYAYRPADNPSHILKSKNDYIRTINHDIEKLNTDYGNADEDIKRAEAKYKHIQEEVQHMKTKAREVHNSLMQAKLDHKYADIELQKWKRDREIETNRKIADMERDYDREKMIAQTTFKLEQAEKNIQARKDTHKKEMDLIKMQTKMENIERSKNHKKALYEHAIQTHRWLGSYEPGTQELRHGAKQLADDGIIFEVGEKDYLESQHRRELEKIQQDAARDAQNIKHELEKLNTKAKLEDAPEYKKLLKQYADAQETLRIAELTKQQEKINTKLQQIDELNHQRALLEAENNVNPKLKQELLHKQQELAQMKAEQSLIKDKAKVERKISEIHAQRGEAEKLQQQILDHKQQYDDIVAANNTKSEQLAQLKQEYSDYVAAANQLDQQTTAYRNAVAATYDKMKRHLTPDEQQAITTVDPTLALNRMLDFAQQRITTRGEYVDRALATASNIQRVFEHDANLAKIGVTLTNVSQQLRENQQAAAYQHIPDFVTVQIEQPPPEVVEQKFVRSFRS